jgi:sialic acid synthase SpsE
MHCNLKYPTPDKEINLRMIEDLKEKFPDCLIGLSDHTMNLFTPALAFCLGANICEKHYTVDKTLGKSADHWLSVDPNDIRQIINYYDLFESMLGEKVKQSTDGEQRAREFARRSIVAISNIQKGSTINENNIGCKRPGTGLSPKLYDTIIGKTATRDIFEDELLLETDFK